jgi:hypothetical protein
MRSQNSGPDGQGNPIDDPDRALAVFMAIEELADSTASAILATSPQLDREQVRSAAAQALFRAVARVAEQSTDDYLNDEDAVLRDAARDMDRWLDRLPSESGWAMAFGQSRDALLGVLG